MRNLIIFIAVLMLVGCAGSPASFGIDLSNSKNAYKNCLKERPGNCNTEKEMYFIDLEAIRALGHSAQTNCQTIGGITTCQSY